MFQLGERFRMIFSTTVVSDSIATVFRQSEPASFDDRGVRVWSGQGEEIVRQSGGAGRAFRGHLLSWRWYLADTAAINVLLHQRRHRRHHIRSVPFHAASGLFEGTDLRLYVTPLNASVESSWPSSVSANTKISGSRSSSASMRRKRHVRRANHFRCGISATSTPLRQRPFPSNGSVRCDGPGTTRTPEDSR